MFATVRARFGDRLRLNGLPDLASRAFRYPASVFTVMLSAYLVTRYEVLHNSRLVMWWDTFSYAYRNDPQWDRGPLVSFTGHAPRLWGAPLLFALFHGDVRRSDAQWAISTVAWALLAWVLWMSFRSLAARVLASGAVLVFALLTPVTEWDFAILSESLSISLGVVVVAMFLLWMRTRTKIPLVVLTAAAFYWTFVRPELRVFVVILIGVLAFFWWRRVELRRAVAASVVVLVGAVAWCSAIMPNVYRSFGPYSRSRISENVELLVWKLPYIYGNPRVKHIYEQQLGMPPCPGALREVGRDWYRMADEVRACPELVAWAEAHGNDPVRFALAAPDRVLADVWNVAPAAFGGVDGYGLYGSPGSVFPAKIDRFMFRADRSRFIALICLVVLAIVGAVLSGALRRRRPYVVTAFVLIVAALVSELAGLIVLDSEPARYSVQENFAVRIALLLLVVSTLDVLVERFTRRTDRGAAAEADVPASTLSEQRNESPPRATSDPLAAPVGVSDVCA